MKLIVVLLLCFPLLVNAQLVVDFNKDTLLRNQEIEANGTIRIKNFLRSKSPTLRFIARTSDQITSITARDIRKCWEALLPGTDSVNFTLTLTSARQFPSPVGKTLPSTFDLQVSFGPGLQPAPRVNVKETPASVLTPGLPFYDALQLAKAEQEGDRKTYQRILAAYGQDSGPKNPFLPAFSALIQQDNLLSANTPTVNGGSAEAGITATAVADALGKFIAKRFKEELNIAYLNGFKTKLANLPELALLLPETHRLLLNTNPYAYTTFLKSLQETSQNDLHNAPENTLALLSSDVMWQRVMIQGDDAINVYGASLAMLQTAERMYRGEKTAIALGKLDKLPALQHLTDKPTGASLRLLAVLARSFSTAQGDFVKREDFNAYANPKVVQYFLALMLEKEKDVLSQVKWRNQGEDAYTFLTKRGSTFLDNNQQVKVDEIKKLVNHLATLVERYQAIRDVRDASASGQITPGGLVRQTLTASLDLVDEALDLSVMIPALAIPPSVKTQYLPLARTVVTLVQAVQEKQYGLALTNALTLSVQLTLIDSVANRFLPANTRQTILEYGTFVVTLINAQNSDEMLVALEAAALPVGSYRIKRNSPFSISLNAYGGLFGAREKFDDLKISNPVAAESYRNVQNGFGWGATAPVGIAFNWGGIDDRSGKKEPPKDFSSFSIFLPLIDVGGVFAFRLQDNVSTLPELAWKNIFAPGIGATYGFRNSPLVLSAFTQYGPQLRKVTIDANEYEPSTWRYGLSLTADIPIFNLFARKQSR